MYILEYDAQRTMDIVYEDGYLKGQEKGRAEGREEERIANLRNLMDALRISLDEAMRLLDIPASERERYL